MTYEVLMQSLTSIFTVQNLLYMIIAIVLGIMAGALPGFTATMAVALMIPFTFTMSPVSGLITIGALYCATIFGGSFSAILLNTPGTPSSIGTTFDGYPMAKKGRGMEAIYTATIGSGVGGILGTFGLILFAVPLAKAALKFGPPEFFWVAIFGLTIISSISEGSLLKGITAGVLGILVSMIGNAPVGGDMRFDFGLVSLQGGVEIVSVLIGFFCIPEIFRMAMNPSSKYTDENVVSLEKGSLKRAFHHVFGHPLATLRASIIGLFVGILPGAGGNIANLIAYNEAKRASKHPETFGTGEPQGVVATETSNNAVVEGAMVPLLALGIPGSPPAAIIYGALLLQGLSPGPQLFVRNASLVYAFMLSFFVANILMVIIGFFAGKGMYKTVIKVPVRVLIPSILFLTILGSYAIRNNAMDVIIMFLSGIIGYILKDLGFNTGAFVLGLILGPIAERGFVQGFLMGNMVSVKMPWIIFFTRPLSIVLIVLSIISGAWPIFRAAMKKRKDRSAIAEALAFSTSGSGTDVDGSQEKTINSDYIGAAIVFGISALFYLQIGKWSKYAIMAPRSILILLIALGVALLVKGRIKPEKVIPSFASINRSLVFLVVVGLLWVFLMEKVGFVVTSMAAYTAILIAYYPGKGARRVIESLLIAGVIVFGMYLLFEKLLNVTLPLGILI
jgi:putative tricarboxylic transport membrane protein